MRHEDIFAFRRRDWAGDFHRVGPGRRSSLPQGSAAAVYLAPAPVATWTGFYAGLNIGGGWASNGGNDSYLPYADTTYPIGSTPFAGASPNLFFLPGGGTTASNTGGVVGGGQVGYNYQFNSFVIGAETDFQGTSITGGHQGNYAGLYDSPYPNSNTGVLSPLVTGNGGNLGLPWFGTVRGRVGYLVTPTLLLYGTGGFAYGGVTAFQRSNTSTGWTAGGGIEWHVRARIGRRSLNISTSISPAAEFMAPTPAGSWATTIIRRSTSCALA